MLTSVSICPLMDANYDELNIYAVKFEVKILFAYDAYSLIGFLLCWLECFAQD